MWYVAYRFWPKPLAESTHFYVRVPPHVLCRYVPVRACVCVRFGVHVLVGEQRPNGGTLRQSVEREVRQRQVVPVNQHVGRLTWRRLVPAAAITVHDYIGYNTISGTRRYQVHGDIRYTAISGTREYHIAMRGEAGWRLTDRSPGIAGFPSRPTCSSRSGNPEITGAGYSRRVVGWRSIRSINSVHTRTHTHAYTRTCTLTGSHTCTYVQACARHGPTNARLCACGALRGPTNARLCACGALRGALVTYRTADAENLDVRFADRR